MHYLFLVDSQVPLGHILDYAQGFLFPQSTLLADVLLQVSVLAELRHDVDIVLGHKDLDCLENVWMSECPQGVDLVVEQVLFDLTLDLAEFQDFDGDGLAIELVESLVDIGAESAADDLCWVVDVILDFLDKFVFLLSTPLFARVGHSKCIIS